MTEEEIITLLRCGVRLGDREYLALWNLK